MVINHQCLHDEIALLTRMHSSRMRTIRGGAVCLPGGVFLLGEVSAYQGGAHFPPGQTDTCEKVSFPELLLRTVIKHWGCSWVKDTNLCKSLKTMVYTVLDAKGMRRLPVMINMYAKKKHTMNHTHAYSCIHVALCESSRTENPLPTRFISTYTVVRT